MRPLTVLFNTYPVAFDCPGGGEVQLQKYEEHLKALGVTVLRYDPWNPGPQFDAADVVHHFSVQYGSWRFCEHVRHTRKLPLLISTIAWMEPEKRTPPPEVGTLLDMCTWALPNSIAEAEQLASIYGTPMDKFIPIVNGVDDIFFETASPAPFREHYDIHEPFVLCMGNIEKRKNQQRLIEALSGTGVHLVLAGQDRESDYAAECRAIADTSVHFVGKLEHGGILQRSAYAAADVLVLPSTMETPGLAALEAAASGTKLALTAIGCTKEYFGDHACYMHPENVLEIKAAVLDAIRRPANGNLPSFVRENYTWHRAATQLLDVYQRAMATFC